MKVAVIGAGISGIASAFYLKKAGLQVDLFEEAPVIGGRIGSERMLGRWMDFGGKNIGRKYHRFRAFVRENGDFPFEYFGFNTSQVIDGRVVQLTKEGRKLSSLFGFVKLAGIRGSARLFPFVKAILKDSSCGMLRTPYFNSVADRFDNASLESLFPPDCSRHLLRPVTVRMNGAEPDECYPGNFGSNLALVLDSYEQLEGGLHQLLDAFVSCSSGQVSFMTGHRVESLCPAGEPAGVEVVFSKEGEHRSALYDKVIAALPAVQLSPVIAASRPDVSGLLDRIRYYPVSVAVAAYRDDVFRKEHRAMVFDELSPLSNAGAYGIHDLNLVRYTFSGRAARSEITAELPAGDVLLQAEKRVAPFFSLERNQRTGMVYKYLSPGLCAYSPHHYLLFAEIQQRLASWAGLHITGDFRRGASIEACFAAAEETVLELVRGERF